MNFPTARYLLHNAAAIALGAMLLLVAACAEDTNDTVSLQHYACEYCRAGSDRNRGPERDSFQREPERDSFQREPKRVSFEHGRGRDSFQRGPRSNA